MLHPPGRRSGFLKPRRGRSLPRIARAPQPPDSSLSYGFTRGQDRFRVHQPARLSVVESEHHLGPRKGQPPVLTFYSGIIEHVVDLDHAIDPLVIALGILRDLVVGPPDVARAAVGIPRPVGRTIP